MNDLQIAVGVPIIAIVNNKNYEVSTSEMYHVVEINDDEIKIKKDDKEKNIAYNDFAKMFKLGFCVTVYKYQGDTIHDHYNIYDVHKMSWNEMYTALSRGVSLDKVHFKFTDKKFEKDYHQQDQLCYHQNQRPNIFQERYT